MQWSRETLVNAAIDILDSGGHLSAHYLTKNYPSMNNAIFYKVYGTNKPKYFGTFLEFRTAVSAELENRGNVELAKKILSKDYKTPMISVAEDERRKRLTIDTLLKKISSKEDLGYRYQKDNYPKFMNNCIRYFGSYRSAFKENGFKYENYVQTKKDRTYYGEKLKELLRKHPDISKESILRDHKILWDRLRNNYGNNTRALHEIAQGVKDESLKNRILSLENKVYKPAAREKRLLQEKKRREEVKEIYSDGIYTRRDFPELVWSGKSTGTELYKKLKNAHRYISTQKAADMLGCEPSNILKNYVHKMPNLVFRYNSNTMKAYFFHKSLFEGYERKNSKKLGTMGSFARERGVTYCKVRSMLDTIGSDSRISNRQREISDVEMRVMDLMLQSEKNTHARMIDIIDPNEEYTTNWLNSRGIPMVTLRKFALEGKIPSRKENNSLVLSGEDIRRVLKSSKNKFRYLLSIHVPAFFDTGLHSIIDVVRNNAISKYLLKVRARTLLAEDFSSIYLLTKEGQTRRSYTLISDEGKELIMNWDDRGKLKLERAINSSEFSHAKSEALRAKHNLDAILSKSTKRHGKEALENIHVLSDYTNERLLIGDVDVTSKHLYLLHRIMENLSYTHVDIDRRYSKADIEDILNIPRNVSAFAKDSQFHELLRTIDTARFALSQDYDYLIDKVMVRNNVSDLDLRLAGEEGLHWAILHHRPGADFVPVAYSSIQRRIRWAMQLHKQTLSLDKGLTSDDNDYTLKNVVAAETTSSILDVLKVLDDKERLIVEEYLGLDGTKKTFAEIAKDIGVTSDKIRDMYESAIKKMRKGYDNSLLAVLE